MLDIKQNVYYRRLAKLALWPLVGFIGLIFVIVVSQILLFYLKYTPELLMPISQSLSPEMVVLIASGINRIIVNLSIWIFVLFVMNILLVYVIWNVKKLVVSLRERKS